MNFTLYTANTCQDRSNTVYPNREMITNPAQLCEAIARDHVCADYTDKRRAEKNFLHADVIMLDCDNDHSDKPELWIKPADLQYLLPEVAFAVTPSRSDNKEKGSRSARPRWHAYFPTESFTDAGKYAALKRRVQKAFPFFDGNALDAARFVFGSHPEPQELVWHDGPETIDRVELPTAEDFGVAPETALQTGRQTGKRIPEGRRNQELHRFALSVLKRYGVTEEARTLFDSFNADCCDPPLEAKEAEGIWTSARSYYDRAIRTDPAYVSPEQYRSTHGSLRPADNTDIGEAVVLATQYKDRILYTPETEYLLYNGTVWEENEQAAKLLLMELTGLQKKEAALALKLSKEALLDAGVAPRVLALSDKEIYKIVKAEFHGLVDAYVRDRAYGELALRYRNLPRIKGAVGCMDPLVRCHITEMDTQPFLLNTPAATYDLRKGLAGAQPHSHADRITRITACSPGEQGKAIWEESLQRTFCGDAKLIEYVQQTVGLAAIGKVFQEAMIIAYGSGRNGKSTFWNTIARVLGDYAGLISADTLTMGCTRNVKPEIAEIRGRRLVIASELEEGMRLSTGTVKQLTSTDKIEAEQKYKAPFQFEPTHLLVLYTNHLPKVSAMDEGTWRRLIVVPFQATIQGDADILNYSDYLYENAGPAILSWIIEGARKVIEADYKPVMPPVVQEACAVYRGDNNWFAHFLEDCCETGEGYKESSGKLYDAYRAWCERNREKTLRSPDFGHIVEHAGFPRKKDHLGAWFSGIRLRKTEMPEQGLFL